MAQIEHIKRAVRGRVRPGAWRRARAAVHWPAVLMATLTGDLPRIASFYQTDKWGDHWYAAHYQRHFAPMRLRPVTLLEIGVGGHTDVRSGGASLRMWKRYFQRGQIYGLDLYDKSAFEEHRIKIFRGDQTDGDLLHQIVERIGRIDIVIDDGSHVNEHVRASFDVLFPLLPDGAIYVIEDTQTSFWPEFGGSEELYAPGTSLALARELMTGLNHAEVLDESFKPSFTDLNVSAVHCYHNMIFIVKSRNDESSNKQQALPERFSG